MMRALGIFGAALAIGGALAALVMIGSVPFQDSYDPVTLQVRSTWFDYFPTASATSIAGVLLWAVSHLIRNYWEF